MCLSTCGQEVVVDALLADRIVTAVEPLELIAAQLELSKKGNAERRGKIDLVALLVLPDVLLNVFMHRKFTRLADSMS